MHTVKNSSNKLNQEENAKDSLNYLVTIKKWNLWLRLIRDVEKQCQFTILNEQCK